MMIGIYEVLSISWNVIKDRRANALPSTTEGSVFAGIGALGVLDRVGLHVPGVAVRRDDDGRRRGPLHVGADHGDRGPTPTRRATAGPAYNFLGYEGRDQYYTEYHDVVTTMEDIGNDPDLGCGRALWENNGDNGQYGTHRWR